MISRCSGAPLLQRRGRAERMGRREGLDERQFGILVVDDEKDFRDLLRFHFEDLGYLVLEAGDGQEALDIFAERRREIDLVITDIRMPRLDGERLIQELRRRDPISPSSA